MDLEAVKLKVTLALMQMPLKPLTPEFVLRFAAELREHAEEITTIATALDESAAGAFRPTEPSGDEARMADVTTPVPAPETGSSLLTRAREALRRAREKAGQ